MIFPGNTIATTARPVGKALVLLLLLVAARAVVAEEQAPPDYNQAIAPLMAKYCVGCHEGEDGESEMALDSFTGLMAGGRRGPAIVPGQADESRLLQMVLGQLEPVMPPEDYPTLSQEEIQLLRQWIDAGANGPEGEPPQFASIKAPKIELTAPVREPITAVAYRPGKGEMVAVGTYGKVRLISAANRGVIRSLEGHSGNVNAVSFSSDGRLLVVAAGEPGLFGEVSIWNVEEGYMLMRVKGHSNSLYAARLSHNGMLLATSSYDRDVKLWNAQTGEEIATLTGHNDAVYDVAFGPEDKLLATVSGDRTVKLWDTTTHERIDTFGESTKALYTVDFSPDGKQIVAGGVDNRIRTWVRDDLSTNTFNKRDPRFAHKGAIIKVVFSPDGSLLATAAEDRTVKLWQVEPLTEKRLWDNQSDWPTALDFSPDGKQLVIGRLDGTLDIFNTEDGKPVPLAAPELASVEPAGLELGVVNRIKLVGKNLVDIRRVVVDRKGFVARALPQETGSGEEAWVEVTLPANAGRGKCKLQVVTAGGESKQLTLEVDDLPQLSESEPNNRPSDTAVARLPASFWGALAAPGDVDCFSFLAEAGQTLVFDLNGRRNGSKIDGVLTLLGPDGEVLASNNDFDATPDPLLTYTVVTPAQYTIRVSDLRFEGSGQHTYQLVAGSLSYVTGNFPLSVPVGSTSRVQFTGYNLPDEAWVEVSPKKEGESSLPIDADRFRSRSALKIVAGERGEGVEAEPNDSPEAATAITVPTTVNGRIFNEAGGTEVDLYAFEAKAGERWIIETDARRRGSPIDTKVEVLDAQGQPVPRLLLEATRDSDITFRPIDSRTVDMRLTNWREMNLNEYLYMQGEVCKLFRHPRGPDSGFNVYGLDGRRITYFDTSSTVHARDEPCYIVRPVPLGTELVPRGLPVFTVYFANDDDGRRRLGNDSYLDFTAPSDGRYLVRVSDSADLGGDRFAYRLVIREPQPDFGVSVSPSVVSVAKGGGRSVTFKVDRVDGFDGDIVIDVSGIPKGFSLSTPVTIEAGHSEASAVLFATPEANEPTKEQLAEVRVTARTEVDGEPREKIVNGLDKMKLDAAGKVTVRLLPASGEEIVIEPGTMVPAILQVDRHDFADRVSFEVENLPHGVIVDDIGLNGVLILEGQTERRIFLTAQDWVQPMTRKVHAVATNAGGQASQAVTLHIATPTSVAQTEKQE